MYFWCVGGRESVYLIVCDLCSRIYGFLHIDVCVCVCVCMCACTCVGKDSLDPTPILCMDVHVVVICCVRLHSIVTLRIGVVELRLGCG